MMFFWKLVEADIAEVRRVVERLRQKAIDLNWLPVGDVVHLTDQECSDGERLAWQFPDDCSRRHGSCAARGRLLRGDPDRRRTRPFGLAAYPGHMEGSSEVVPTHLAGWQWIGVIRSDDYKPSRFHPHGCRTRPGSHGLVRWNGDDGEARREGSGQVRGKDGVS